MDRRPGGPAAYLAAGSSWLDAQGIFDIPLPESMYLEPCQDMWAISAAIRAARGRARRSAGDVAACAYVRRQTLTDIEVGRSWADAATLSRICAQLGMRLAVAPAEPEKTAP